MRRALAIMCLWLSEFFKALSDWLYPMGFMRLKLRSRFRIRLRARKVLRKKRLIAK